jgi:hypothetical protein
VHSARRHASISGCKDSAALRDGRSFPTGMLWIWRVHRTGDRRHEQRRWQRRDWRCDQHGRKQRRRGKHEQGRFCGDWRLGRRSWRVHRTRDRRHEQRRWQRRDWRCDQHGRKQRRRGKHEQGRFCGDWRLGRRSWLASQRREHSLGRGWHCRKRRRGDRWNAEHRRRNSYRRFACDRWRHCNWGNHQHWRYKGHGWSSFNRRGDHWRRKRRSGWFGRY